MGQQQAAKVICLPGGVYRRGMLWPWEFVGDPEIAHHKALGLSMKQDVVVDFGDRVVGYRNGVAELCDARR